MQSERNGDPDLFAATSEARNDETRGLAGSLSSTELDGKIKKLALEIEAGFLSRARFLEEFSELRALLNAQLARARTLVHELPANYLSPIADSAVAVADPDIADNRTPSPQ